MRDMSAPARDSKQSGSVRKAGSATCPVDCDFKPQNEKMSQCSRFNGEETRDQ